MPETLFALDIDFLPWFERLGIPLTLLCAILVAIYRFGTWLAANIAKPLMERHLKFIEKIETVQDKQAETLDRIATVQSQQSISLNTLTAASQTQTTVQNQTVAAIRELSDSIKEAHGHHS